MCISEHMLVPLSDPVSRFEQTLHYEPALRPGEGVILNHSGRSCQNQLNTDACGLKHSLNRGDNLSSQGAVIGLCDGGKSLCNKRSA